MDFKMFPIVALFVCCVGLSGAGVLQYSVPSPVYGGYKSPYVVDSPVKLLPYFQPQYQQPFVVKALPYVYHSIQPLVYTPTYQIPSYQNSLQYNFARGNRNNGGYGNNPGSLSSPQAYPGGYNTPSSNFNQLFTSPSTFNGNPGGFYGNNNPLPPLTQDPGKYGSTEDTKDQSYGQLPPPALPSPSPDGFPTGLSSDNDDSYNNPSPPLGPTGVSGYQFTAGGPKNFGGIEGNDPYKVELAQNSYSASGSRNTGPSGPISYPQSAPSNTAVVIEKIQALDKSQEFAEIRAENNRNINFRGHNGNNNYNGDNRKINYNENDRKINYKENNRNVNYNSNDNGRIRNENEGKTRVENPGKDIEIASKTRVENQSKGIENVSKTRVAPEIDARTEYGSKTRPEESKTRVEPKISVVKKTTEPLLSKSSTSSSVKATVSSSSQTPQSVPAPKGKPANVVTRPSEVNTVVDPSKSEIFGQRIKPFGRLRNRVINSSETTTTAAPGKLYLPPQKNN